MMMRHARSAGAIWMGGSLLLILSGACKPGSDKSADPLQQQLHSNICQEGKALPQRLQAHLDPCGEIAAALAAMHPAGVKTACLALERSARDNCGSLGEFERISSGSATLLGFRNAENWGNDPFGRDLCSQLVLTAMYCEDQPDQEASKVRGALADFAPELSKRLAGFLSTCQ